MSEQRLHSHYFKDIKGLDVIDVYRLLELFEVTCPVAQHIIKKGLAAGKRGAKDKAKDMKEIFDSSARWIEMREEDAGRNGFAGYLNEIDGEKLGSFGRLDELKYHEHTGLPHGLSWDTAPAQAVALIGVAGDPDCLIWSPAREGVVTGWRAVPMPPYKVGDRQSMSLSSSGNHWYVVAVRPTPRTTGI